MSASSRGSKPQYKPNVSVLMRKYSVSTLKLQKHGPLLRFKKTVKIIQILLRATQCRTKRQRNDGLFPWGDNSSSSTRREYSTIGLSFDPADFNAKKILSNEVKAILSLEPDQRTEEQLKLSLIAITQVVEAFSEFPITMQKSLVRVGWYQRFKDKRVIIRQGHLADNFYFILSGTAIVTIMQTEKDSKQDITRTAAVLRKGNSFGELALLHGSKRTATVTCKDSIELLAVGRDDFIDIFMPTDKDREPEHIQFLRNIPALEGWPLESLPHHDSKVCCFMYFRRGITLCKDSNTSEWVYIVKTGTCRVLMALRKTKPQTSRLKGKFRSGDFVLREENRILLDELLLEKKSSNILFKKKSGIAGDKNQQHMDLGPDKTVYVQITTLGPGDIYGLEQIVFDRIAETTSTILVSDGAECILIDGRYFQQNLTERVSQRMMKTIQAIPSKQDLQQKLQDKTNWEAYKTFILTNLAMRGLK